MRAAPLVRYAVTRSALRLRSGLAVVAAALLHDNPRSSSVVRSLLPMSDMADGRKWIAPLSTYISRRRVPARWRLMKPSQLATD
jgi:hypothetical protein